VKPENEDQKFQPSEGAGPRPPFPVRFLSVGMLFGQVALDYDSQPDATSLLTNDDVAELLRATGNLRCHPEYLAQLRSQITAWAQLREAQANRPKEGPSPDERVARAVHALRKYVPERLDRLQEEIEVMPEDMRAVRVLEIGRLGRLLAAAAEDPHLPLETYNDPQIDAGTLVSLLAFTYDSAYGSSRAWEGSPKVKFIAAAVHRAGWRNKTPAAIEQQLLRFSRKRSIATKP
jgi:hypothetical protein